MTADVDMSSIGLSQVSFEGDSPITATYKMIPTDSRGLLLDEPYLGISIDGSPWFDVAQIVATAEAIKEKPLEAAK